MDPSLRSESRHRGGAAAASVALGGGEAARSPCPCHQDDDGFLPRGRGSSSCVREVAGMHCGMHCGFPPTTVQAFSFFVGDERNTPHEKKTRPTAPTDGLSQQARARMRRLVLPLALGAAVACHPTQRTRRRRTGTRWDSLGAPRASARLGSRRRCRRGCSGCRRHPPGCCHLGRRLPLVLSRRAAPAAAAARATLGGRRCHHRHRYRHNVRVVRPIGDPQQRLVFSEYGCRRGRRRPRHLEQVLAHPKHPLNDLGHGRVVYPTRPAPTARRC